MAVRSPSLPDVSFEEIVDADLFGNSNDPTPVPSPDSSQSGIYRTSSIFTPCLTRTSLGTQTEFFSTEHHQNTCISTPDFTRRFTYGRNLDRRNELLLYGGTDGPFLNRLPREGDQTRNPHHEVTQWTRTSQVSTTGELSFYNLLSLHQLPDVEPACRLPNCPCCTTNTETIHSLRKRLKVMVGKLNEHTEFTLYTLLEMSMFLLEDPDRREHAIDTLEHMDSRFWRNTQDLEIYRKVMLMLHFIEMERKGGEKERSFKGKVRLYILCGIRIPTQLSIMFNYDNSVSTYYKFGAYLCYSHCQCSRLNNDE